MVIDELNTVKYVVLYHSQCQILLCSNQIQVKFHHAVKSHHVSEIPSCWSGQISSCLSNLIMLVKFHHVGRGIKPKTHWHLEFILSIWLRNTSWCSLKSHCLGRNCLKSSLFHSEDFRYFLPRQWNLRKHSRHFSQLPLVHSDVSGFYTKTPGLPFNACYLLSAG